MAKVLWPEQIASVVKRLVGVRAALMRRGDDVLVADIEGALRELLQAARGLEAELR